MQFPKSAEAVDRFSFQQSHEAYWLHMDVFMKLFGIVFILALNSGFAQAATLCSQTYQLMENSFDFQFDSQINSAVKKQIRNYISDANTGLHQKSILKISVATEKEALSMKSAWAFPLARPNDLIEEHLLLKSHEDAFPKSMVLYKMTYADGSVSYSDIYENQTVMDSYFISSWIVGDQYVAHGLPTDAWPNLLKQIVKKANHGELVQVEKMVSSEIPLVTVSQEQNSKTLPIFDANYEGLAARDEERQLGRNAPHARYLLSFVFPNGLTMSRFYRQ